MFTPHLQPQSDDSTPRPYVMSRAAVYRPSRLQGPLGALLSGAMALLTGLLLVAVMSGCATTYARVDNTPSARNPKYVPIDQTTPGSRQLGIESQDIVAMTDRIMRDMMTSHLANSQTIPVVIMDETYFVNDSSQPLNKHLIVDRLRNGLFRAADGRMRFLARHQQDMVDDEQYLREIGAVDGEVKWTQPTADFRLSGRFQNLAGGSAYGHRDNYVQVLFEMIDLNNGELVYSGMYEFKKAMLEDRLYF